MFEVNQIINNDCLRIMPLMDLSSIDLIICDLPYGVTANKWDSTINLPELWKCYRRILKPNGIVILTAIQPFTSHLVSSNLSQFRHELIWEKDRGTSYLVAARMPLRVHENILIFSPHAVTYNPQYELGEPYKGKRGQGSKNYNGDFIAQSSDNNGLRHPHSILRFPRTDQRLHPTQKPVALIEYLIKSYSEPGDIVLDNCIGSGTTAIAAMKSERQWLGIEKDTEVYQGAIKRVEHFLQKGYDYSPKVGYQKEY